MEWKKITIHCHFEFLFHQSISVYFAPSPFVINFYVFSCFVYLSNRLLFACASLLLALSVCLFFFLVFGGLTTQERLAFATCQVMFYWNPLLNCPTIFPLENFSIPIIFWQKAFCLFFETYIHAMELQNGLNYIFKHTSFCVHVHHL